MQLPNRVGRFGSSCDIAGTTLLAVGTDLVGNSCRDCKSCATAYRTLGRWNGAIYSGVDRFNRSRSYNCVRCCNSRVIPIFRL